MVTYIKGINTNRARVTLLKTIIEGCLDVTKEEVLKRAEESIKRTIYDLKNE